MAYSVVNTGPASGLDLTDLKYQVVEPALVAIGLNTLAGLNLVTGTALVESGAARLVQVNGPALGLWQVEPATEQDAWKSYLDYNPAMANAVQSALAPGDTTEQLVWNLCYGAMMCRIKYWRAPQALPAYNDAAGMASMWKAVYNSAAGAGSADAATIAMFQQAINA